jgi:predicted RNase H-like nuclease
MATTREEIHENWDAQTKTVARSLLKLRDRREDRTHEDDVLDNLIAALSTLFAEVDWLRDRVKQLNEEASAGYLLSRLATRLSEYDTSTDAGDCLRLLRGKIVKLICDVNKERLEKKQADEPPTAP